MPVRPCQNEGRVGYKWGDDGVCYTGRDARKEAIRQGLASQVESGTLALEEFADCSKEEIYAAAADIQIPLGQKILLHKYFG